MTRTVLSVSLILLAFTATRGAGQGGVSREEYTGLDKYLGGGRPEQAMTGVPAAEFLVIPAEARGAGLGNAYGAVSEGASSLWWNPAGLVFADRYETSISHFQYIPDSDVSYTYLSAAIPLIKGKLAAGVVFGYLGRPNMPVTTMQQPQGSGKSYQANDYQLGGSLAYRPHKTLSLGFTLKRVRQNIYGNSSLSGIAVDFGVRYRFEFDRHQLSLSFAGLNYGSSLESKGPNLSNEEYSAAADNGNLPDGYGVYENRAEPMRRERAVYVATSKYKLPSSYSIGLAYSLRVFEKARIMLAYEYRNPKDYGEKRGSFRSIGVEFSFPLNGFLAAAVRTGWQTRKGETGGYSDFSYVYMGDNLKDNTDFRVGAGIEAKIKGAVIRFDYAYRDMNRDVGRIQSISETRNFFSLGLGI